MVLIRWATHVLQRRKQREATAQVQATPQKLPQYGLLSETRKYEVEIVSNRRLAGYGELNFEFCTHCPSRSESCSRRELAPCMQSFYLRNFISHRAYTKAYVNARIVIRVKLTQGTGMGTCRWNNFLLRFFLSRPNLAVFYLTLLWGIIQSYEGLIVSFSVLFFGIFSFYYLFNTVIFEFLCFVQAFNERHIKASAETSIYSTLEVFSSRAAGVTTVLLAYLFV